MLSGRVVFFFLFLPLVNVQIQINLHLTDWVNEDSDLRHDCLNIPALIDEGSDTRQVISYCMGEWPSKLNITENDVDQKFTFSQLSQRHITTEQLYLWSAPIDLIEEYGKYLDELPHSNKTSLAIKYFYNCTLPYFGSKCEYSLASYNNKCSLLNEMISDYYSSHTYQPTSFTCYEHLKCHRGPSPSCLDWTEICDGKVDCFDGGEDEKHCWQLELLQCREDEFQCTYGQCIPKSFFHDGQNTPDCLDQSDETLDMLSHFHSLTFDTREPVFKFEDVSCAKISPIATTDTRYLPASSCVSNRDVLLAQAMFSVKPRSINDECWTALKCIVHLPFVSEETCAKLRQGTVCDDIMKNMSDKIIYIPSGPILHDHAYLAFDKSKLEYTGYPIEPTYVCFDDRRLDLPDDGKNLLLSDNKTCRLFVDATFGTSDTFPDNWLQLFVRPIDRWLHKSTPLIYNNSIICDRLIMYQCMNSSKCISKARILDSTYDCYHGDDETVVLFNFTDDMLQLQNLFRCKTSNQYLPYGIIDDGICDCIIPGDSYCADEYSIEVNFRKTITFQTICDHVVHLTSEFLGDQNDTDETDCEQWPLIHVYNRCDGFWNLPNGSDELNCHSSLSLLNCSEDHHTCVSSETKKLICLPLDKVNDGIVHCFGATDEPTLCPRNILKESYPKIFYCENIHHLSCILGDFLCDGRADCLNNEDEEACQSNDLIASTTFKGICTRDYELDGSDIAKVLCRLFVNSGKRKQTFFTLDQSQNSIGHYSEHVGDEWIPVRRDISVLNNIHQYTQPRCHRGLDLQVLLDKERNSTTNVCLCPPSFYGNICQYQNQRISLALQFHTTSHSIRTPFIIIISLIDNSDERIIHSHEQFNYLFTKYCQKKFNFYLLYSTRPKNPVRQYFIHIDIYEKITLNYRASFIKPVNYSFLPVHRLAFELHIPFRHDDQIQSCSDKKCINGKCVRYLNDPNNQTFCQCLEGWIGQYCNIKYTCLCSSQSLCLGKLANNRSLCVCHWNKMGPRCLIDNYICQIHEQNATCMNGGQCIAADDYEISTNKFTCICLAGFYGDRCEINRAQVTVSFEKNLNLPSRIFIHFIEVKMNAFPVHTTTSKKIYTGQDSVNIYWSLPFHIVLIELLNHDYYLLLMQKTYEQSLIIEKTLTTFNRCLSINEVFNETLLNYPLLRRIKYYHLPCQTNSSLACFYDEQQLCLCQQLDHQRLANCFDFKHNSRAICSGRSGCEHGGKCIQENSKCPKYFFCQCEGCYYGERCQLKTDSFSLSLDAILGFLISPNIKIFKQPRAVLVSAILSTIIIIGGLTNGILSSITFQSKKIRESGCGIYLLNSSGITLLTMIIFTLKFWIFILSQTGSIRNQSFLNVECILIDFFLRLCLTMDQWLTAFVSIERAFITIKGLNFNKKKTKLIAKYTICVLLLIAILTNIHDPIHRSLFEENGDDDGDDNEKRFWCIVKYSSSIRTVNYIINTFHFIAPFIINLISASIIIIVKSQQRTSVQSGQNYREIFKEQILQHKNLLVGPLVLIILGIPRLIITFASGCMKRENEAWLFLFGYFISLIPPTLTFILFVLPSTIYKQEFHKAFSHYRNIFK